MLRFVIFGFLLTGTLLLGDDQPTVFKSDVAMTRVDAQVLGRDGRAISGLQVNDFKLTLNGHLIPVKSLASENMPIDILLLLDVSGSMEPHVERLASAARQALNVLAPKDRVAIMVFDTNTRLRLPFNSDHDEITQGLNHVLRSERFNRGTAITSALISAASYVQRQARPDARKAIVIMTDDETQDEEDVPRVDSALARANAVLSFLQAPYEVPTIITHRRGGTWGGGGGGGGMGWPGGGVGFPGGGGGGSWPGGGGMGRRGGMDPSHSAGTADIARDSGGDTMNVEEASALEDTLARLRQRYALYFNYPEDADSSTPENVKVDLSNEAKIRYVDAEIHYRHVYMASNAGQNSGVTSVTRTHVPDAESTPSPSRDDSDTSTSTNTHQRRRAVSDDSGSSVNTMSPESDASPSSGSSAASPRGGNGQTEAPASKPSPKSQGGWPSANPDTGSSPR